MRDPSLALGMITESILAGRLWRSLCACRGHGWRTRDGSSLSILLNETPHRIGRLGAFAQPVFGALSFDRAVVAGLFWIVGADDFNELSIAWTATIRDHDLVIRAIFRAFSA
jgi:hypothetical protein